MHEHVLAFGGLSTGAEASHGGAGTIFVQPEGASAGDLIVRNDGTQTPRGSTALVTLPPGQFLNVESNAVEVAGPLTPDRYAGYLITPNTEEGNKGLADDTRLLVVGNDETHLFISPAADLSAAAQVGDSYRSAFVFRNLEVAAGASLETAGDLLVLEGDLESQDDTTFVLRGEALLGRLDLSGVESVAIHDVGLSADDILAQDSDETAFALRVEDAYLKQPTLWAGQADLVNAEVEVDTIHLSEDLTLSGTTTLQVAKDTLSVGDTMTLVGSAQVRHTPSSAERARGLEFTLRHLSVGPQAHINANGLGFPAGTTGEGPLAPGVVSGFAGGSYGGLGGQDGAGSPPGPVYGVLELPGLPGAGSAQGGAGGGMIIIHAEQTVTVKGRLSADGESHAMGGGAGGTIRIHSPSLLGDGEISARGGEGGEAPCGEGCSQTSGSGSGGRIALVDIANWSGAFTVAAEHAGLSASGGAGVHPGGAGTIIMRDADASYIDMLVDNAGIDAGPGSTPLVTLPTGTIIGLGADTVTVSEPLEPDRHAGYLVNLGLDLGGPGLLDDAIYPIASNDVVEFMVDSGDDDLSAVVNQGTPYRSVFIFRNLEVRHGARLSTEGDIIVLEGDISSDDEATFALTGGVSCHRLDLNEGSNLALSAGSELEVTQVLQGNSEDIALSYVINDSSLSLPLVEATLLSASNSTLEIGQLVAQSAVTLVDTHLNVTQGKIDLGATGSLNLEGTSVVTHPPSDGDTLRKLHITGMNVIIGGDASIDLTGKGYGAFTTAQGSTPTMAPAGASHGGTGGQGYAAQEAEVVGSAGDTYGVLQSPSLPGAGGSVPGGGVLRLELQGVLKLDGTILANGASVEGSDDTASPGAGGSVWISTTTMAGSGRIEAQGGASTEAGCIPGQCPNTQLGGGGGGRIALTGHVLLSGSFLDLPSALSAYGGGGYQSGGAGTVFVRSHLGDDDTLLVHNNPDDTSTLAGLTHLPSVPEGLVLLIQGDQLFDFGAFTPNTLAGLMLDPNVSQGSSLSLSDHLLFEVASNSADALTLVPAQAGTQLGDVSGVGKAYRGVLPLSHLSVRDNAQLVTQGDLLVWSGDPYGPGFAIEAGASLSARGLDVVSLQGPQDFDGDIFVDALMCGGSCP